MRRLRLVHVSASYSNIVVTTGEHTINLVYGLVLVLKCFLFFGNCRLHSRCIVDVVNACLDRQVTSKVGELSPNR